MVRVLVPYRAVSCGCIGLRTSVAAKRPARTTAGVLAAVATAGLREASPAPRRMPCRAVAVGAHGPVGHSAAGTLRCCVCIQVGGVCLFVSRSGKLFVCWYPGQGSCPSMSLSRTSAHRRAHACATVFAPPRKSETACATACLRVHVRVRAFRACE